MEKQESSFLNLANIITISRLFLIILMVPLVLSKNYLLNLFGLIIFILSMVLDWYDGFVARKLEVQTKFGSFFDVIVDRVSEVLIFSLFFLVGMIPFLIPLIFLIRGLATDYITFLSFRKYGYKKTQQKIFRSKFGKINVSNFIVDLYGIFKAIVMLFILSVYLWQLPFKTLAVIFAWLITLFNILRGIFVIYDYRGYQLKIKRS